MADMGRNVKELRVMFGEDISVVKGPSGTLVAQIGEQQGPKELRFWRGCGTLQVITYGHHTIRRDWIPGVEIPADGVLIQVDKGSEFHPAEYIILDVLPANGKLRQLYPSEVWILVE